MSGSTLVLRRPIETTRQARQVDPSTESRRMPP